MDALPPSISNGAVYPWDRQEGESPKAFHAFTLYKDAGSERSLTHVAQRLHVSKQAIGRWSSHHHWVGRSLAWDNYQSRTVNDAVLRDLVQQARQLQKKAGEGLDAITKGGKIPTIAEVCLMLRTVVSLAECAGGNGHGREVLNEYGAAADLPQPRFFRIELIPGLDPGWRYFRVPKEDGSIDMEHSGQVREDAESQQRLLEVHPTAFIVK